MRGQKPYVVGGIENPAIKLNQNESPYDLPSEIKREVLEAIAKIPFNRYPLEQPARLMRAFADFVGHDPEGVLVGNGSNELTFTLALAMVEHGTPVVLPRPMFTLYETAIRLHGGDLTSIPPRANLSFDTEAILAAVEEKRPALTVLTTPNNPTGLAMPLHEVEAIVGASPGFVVVDEAYVEFADEESAFSLLGEYPNLIILRTLSKAWGLAGLRLGFLLAHPAVTKEILKARLPFMIDPIAETTALTLMRHRGLLDERARMLKAASRALTVELQAIKGVEVIPSQSNFVLFRTGLEPALLMSRLAESGVLVRNVGGYPELRGYLRVNAGTEAENNAFLVALKHALLSHR
ncbi:MAG: histidinol-phosphate transaminase [Rhodothermales bacterium]